MRNNYKCYTRDNSNWLDKLQKIMWYFHQFDKYLNEWWINGQE